MSDKARLRGVTVCYWCIKCRAPFKLRFSKWTDPVARCDICLLLHEFTEEEVELMRKAHEVRSYSIGLEALEEKQYELQRFVEIHEIRY